MSEKKAIQIGNKASGDIAAGDINHNETYHFHPAGKKSPLEKLYERFKVEGEEPVALETKIEELEHYTSSVGTESIVGLQAKLVAGNRQENIPFAEQCKEAFTKKLARASFSKSAQEIYAYLLAQVWTRFNAHVFPFLATHSKAEIDEKIQTKVVDPIRDELGENIFRLHEDALWGMIYFLTGTCRIKWSA